MFSYDDFKKSVSNKSVELIEAKQKLNRFVIGQVIAGYDMFEREYNPQYIEMVIYVLKAIRHWNGFARKGISK